MKSLPKARLVELEGPHFLPGFALCVQAKNETMPPSPWACSALNRVVRADPHLKVMSALEGHMGATRFIEWQAKGALLPPAWADAMARFERGSGHA